MLGNEAQAAALTLMLAPVSAANTAAATTPWIDVRRIEGDIAVLIAAGVGTGTLTPTLEQATDNSGTGAVALVPNEGVLGAQTQNTFRKLTFRAQSTLGFVRVVGTIVTGPFLVAAHLQGRPKNF
jgi:hypothetical protein